MKSKTEKLLDELVKLHPKYIDLSLDRLKLLLKKLGNPQDHLPKTIHIAGTNGKGSVQSFIRNILFKNGYKCDAYISPHLSRFNERIILNNKEVSTKKLYETLIFVKKINNNKPITFFEITTAAAFILFKQSRSDFLILETGLGGRLDATNIIPKKICSILTPISFDHEEFLGKTLKKIANEKLGIVKNCKFVLVGKQKKELKDHIQKKLNKFENKYFYGKEYQVTKSLKNKFQIKIDGKKYYYEENSMKELKDDVYGYISSAIKDITFSTVVGEVVEIIDEELIKIKQHNPGVLKKRIELISSRNYYWSKGGAEMRIEDLNHMKEYYKKVKNHEKIAEIDIKLKELNMLREQLTALASACQGDDRPDCPILDALSDRKLD